MANSDSPVSTLSEDSSWGLLANLEVGRLATIGAEYPEIFPINFVIDGMSIVFRTASGSKLDDLTRNKNVAFEADTWDLEGGRSVVIKGVASPITDEDELRRAQALPLNPWVPTVKTHFVRISPTDIQGRIFQFGPEPTA